MTRNNNNIYLLPEGRQAIKAGTKKKYKINTMSRRVYFEK